MTSFNFEGDITNISETQLKFINSVIIEQGYENSKIVFEAVGKPGDNYVANVKRIIIDGGNEIFKLIAKIAPTFEPIRQAMNTATAFKNEHTMYTKVLPKLVELQKNADIPKEEHLRFAKCYGTHMEEPNEVILLEDLTVSDFMMLDRFTPLSNDCIKSVLKNFAVLHSLSFVLKSKDPETYNNFKENLINVWWSLRNMAELKILFQSLENDTIQMLEDQKHIDFLRQKVANTLNVAQKCAKIDSTSKYTVIQQGDSWTNNIMFRFEGDNLKNSIMIDYQISKHTSPVCDIMYLIFNCTDHETNTKQFYNWIDYYHSELDKSLSNFNLKVNFIYPRDRLDADLKQYSKFIFGLTVLLASVLIRNTEDAAKIKDAMQTDKMTSNTPGLMVSSLNEDTKLLFKNKVVGLIESFSALGL